MRHFSSVLLSILRIFQMSIQFIFCKLNVLMTFSYIYISFFSSFVLSFFVFIPLILFLAFSVLTCSQSMVSKEQMILIQSDNNVLLLFAQLVAKPFWKWSKHFGESMFGWCVFILTFSAMKLKQKNSEVAIKSKEVVNWLLATAAAAPAAKAN